MTKQGSVLEVLTEVPQWYKDRLKAQPSKAKVYAKEVLERLKALPADVDVTRITIPEGYKLIGIHACLSQLTKGKEDIPFKFARDHRNQATELIAVRK